MHCRISYCLAKSRVSVIDIWKVSLWHKLLKSFCQKPTIQKLLKEKIRELCFAQHNVIDRKCDVMFSINFSRLLWYTHDNCNAFLSNSIKPVFCFFQLKCITGKPVSWMMISPSVTPRKMSIGSNNPAMRLYKFDTDSGQVSSVKPLSFIYAYVSVCVNAEEYTECKKNKRKREREKEMP